jgi:general secretion pathway protein N
MTRSARQARRRWGPLLLLGLCLALGAIILLELGPSSDSAVNPAFVVADPPRPAAGSPAGAPVPMPSREAYSEILARPLFTPSRRPPEPVESTPRQAPAPLTITLAGIAMSADQRIAIVQTGNPPRVLRLAEGQQLDGWTVITIAADRLVLRSHLATEEVKIKDVAPSSGAKANPPRAASPTPTPQARPANRKSE